MYECIKTRILLFVVAMLMSMKTFALGLINNFEWLEPNNKIEIVIGEPYQLKFSCSNNNLPFTNDYLSSWIHYDFAGGQHVVNSPNGYSIDEKGVITGLAVGTYAIKFTGWIQSKDDVDKFFSLLLYQSDWKRSQIILLTRLMTFALKFVLDCTMSLI